MQGQCDELAGNVRLRAPCIDSHHQLPMLLQRFSVQYHVSDGAHEADFVARRRVRDATLALPALMLPSVQVKVRAGRMPPPDANGTAYLKIPVDRL